MLLAGSGLAKHGEKRSWLMAQLGLGYGDANTVVSLAGQPLPGPEPAGPASMARAAPAADPLDALYAGKRAALRPLHEALMAALAPFGAFETAPKKAYVSLRRSKQFAVIEAASATRLQVGLQLRDHPTSVRLLAWGGMCSHKANVSELADVDGELVGWLRQAYERN